MPTKNSFESQYLYGKQNLVKEEQQKERYRLGYVLRLRRGYYFFHLIFHQIYLDGVALRSVLPTLLPLALVQNEDILARLSMFLSLADSLKQSCYGFEKSVC